MPVEWKWDYFAVLKLATIFVNCKFWAKKLKKAANLTPKAPAAHKKNRNRQVIDDSCFVLYNERL